MSATAPRPSTVERWTRTLNVMVPRLRAAGLLGRRVSADAVERLVRAGVLFQESRELLEELREKRPGDQSSAEELAKCARQARAWTRAAAAGLGIIAPDRVEEPAGPDGDDAELRAWFDAAVPLVAARAAAIAAADAQLLARLTAAGLPAPAVTGLREKLARLRAAIGAPLTVAQVEVARTNGLRVALLEAQTFLSRPGSGETAAWDVALQVAKVLQDELGDRAVGPDLEDPELPGAGDDVLRDGGRP